MNLVQRAVSKGGKLTPLIIQDERAVFGAMNPSIFIDDDDDILVNLRIVNYTLYHSEKDQKFPTPWGPLAYLHPENDIRLATENYLCKLNPNLEVEKYTKVEMLNLHTPIWEFHGLEDARVVKWDGKYYLCGVRRDTTTNGQGRMEYSEIALDKDVWTAKEVSRVRIPAPGDDFSYCEKNWMPILDKPYHFIKWCSPTEVVMANPDTPECTVVSKEENYFKGKDQRGGSQAFRWGKWNAVITHEVDLFKNYLGQKDAVYRHRLLLWTDDWEFIGASNPFAFLDFPIEFCVGAAVHNENLIVSFAAADNAAFTLLIPETVVDELAKEALDAGDAYRASI